jgi:hypothetical protein
MRKVVRHALLAGVASLPVLFGSAAHADLPVIDVSALGRAQALVRSHAG